MWEFHQYTEGGDPNGHSIMQRLESWKAALHVIKAHPLFGVGTGDLPNQVNNQYGEMHSKLDGTHYLRPHNQYLAIAVAFGITGLCYFLFTLCYPLYFSRNRNYFYFVFFLTLVISMLTEDTLETQPGATFFAFFNAFFLFAMPGKSKTMVR
jgi:O-antigen ligase